MTDEWPQDDEDVRLLLEAEEKIAGDRKSDRCELCITGVRVFGSLRCPGCQDRSVAPVRPIHPWSTL